MPLSGRSLRKAPNCGYHPKRRKGAFEDHPDSGNDLRKSRSNDPREHGSNSLTASSSRKKDGACSGFPLEQSHHLMVQNRVGGHDAFRVWRERLALQGGDEPSGLLHHQDARRRIPGFQPDLPESVKAPRCYIAQVDRSRTGPSDSLGAQYHSCKAIDVQFRILPQVVRKSCTQKGFAQTGRPGHAHRMAVQARPAAPPGFEDFSHDRTRNNPQLQPTLDLQRDRNGKQWKSMRIVRCPIQGVYQPDTARITVVASRFLGQHTVRGEMSGDRLHNQILRLNIRIGHQIDPALFPYVNIVPVKLNKQSACRLGGLTRHIHFLLEHRSSYWKRESYRKTYSPSACEEKFRPRGLRTPAACIIRANAMR
ncbi:hypothetical protein TRIP_B170078 [uncultured Desulfatiglans sp.]|uniref:Uncharacterized protein n=1 Tax=Uncultured Desulfatiglans sp. TaxID=1748965 RepID=A0A653A182_UNCDX|nr:hypothetical protein TRIP_B170078 [uncultured Desulfatiglans sp.]